MFVGLSSGVMCSLSLDAPICMALPVYSAPFTRPQLNQDAPDRNKQAQSGQLSLTKKHCRSKLIKQEDHDLTC